MRALLRVVGARLRLTLSRRAGITGLASLAVVAALAIFVVTSAGWALGGARDVEEKRFPHAKHARLFPECETCHEGVTTGDSATRFPTAVSCEDCHDGTRQKRVDWNGPAVAPSNLNFSHPNHARAAEKETPVLECRTCHGISGGDTFMAVARATPELCIGCHSHKASGHLADDAPCARCHAPLTRATRLSDSAVAAIPIPEGHNRADFLAQHAPRSPEDGQRCATCHARQSCARCHPNAKETAQVASLESDARVARVLRGRAPRYFKPRSHEAGDYLLSHGDSASQLPASCANCHAQPSCRTCHTARSAAKVLARLAGPDADGAAGVRLQVVPLEPGAAASGAMAFPHTPRSAMAPNAAEAAPLAIPHVARQVAGNPLLVVPDTVVRQVRVHPPDFVEKHGPTAASGRLNCQGCHEERTCTSCHNGGSRRRFHAFNFVSRHAASAVGRERDCASCHTTETFCRECHRGQGMEARGTRSVAYHDRQPLWLQQHGQAARQEMQTCATCHQQRDCMQCHSNIGLRVNPHGPGFDAERMAKRNRQMCLMCHISDPLRRSP
ncbi:MAG: cytochrome c3 family protein [Gemmatimonadaceae bacterium]|nr:cytochrome c3 family protein [Gemmatimonadaceae bacterium]